VCVCVCETRKIRKHPALLNPPFATTEILDNVLKMPQTHKFKIGAAVLGTHESGNLVVGLTIHDSVRCDIKSIHFV
jgi:hypothetical protein